MHLRRAEMQQAEVQIDKRAEAERGDDRADAELAAEQKAGDRDQDIRTDAADTGGAPGLSRERDHQRVTRPCAERTAHIHPCAECEQFESCEQHRDAAGERMQLRHPVEREHRVDAHAAADDVDDRADAEALAEQDSQTDRGGARDDRGEAVGDRQDERQALLEHAPRLQTDVCLKHEHDAERADDDPGCEPEQAAHVITQHGVTTSSFFRDLALELCEMAVNARL